MANTKKKAIEDAEIAKETIQEVQAVPAVDESVDCEQPTVAHIAPVADDGYWTKISECSGMITYTSNNDTGCMVMVNCYGNIALQYIEKGRYDDERGTIVRMV